MLLARSAALAVADVDVAASGARLKTSSCCVWRFVAIKRSAASDLSVDGLKLGARPLLLRRWLGLLLDAPELPPKPLPPKTSPMHPLPHRLAILP